ncbi:unnamed protein product, partial [Gadus morhua 'NCC']
MLNRSSEESHERRRCRAVTRGGEPSTAARSGFAADTLAVGIDRLSSCRGNRPITASSLQRRRGSSEPPRPVTGERNCALWCSLLWRSPRKVRGQKEDAIGGKRADPFQCRSPGNATVNARAMSRRKQGNPQHVSQREIAPESEHADCGGGGGGVGGTGRNWAPCERVSAVVAAG